MGRRRAGLWGWEGGERGGGRGCSHCLVKEQGFFTITGCVGCENLSSWLQSGLIGLFGYPRTEPDVPGIVAGFSTYKPGMYFGHRISGITGSGKYGLGLGFFRFGVRVSGFLRMRTAGGSELSSTFADKLSLRAVTARSTASGARGRGQGQQPGRGRPSSWSWLGLAASQPRPGSGTVPPRQTESSSSD
jgi:hypothetical protein